MTSKKIIERLQQKDWFVKCETEHELALLLNACLDANVGWTNKKSVVSLRCSIPVPILMGVHLAVGVTACGFVAI
ncbi:MAG: hypothetical protein J6569_07080 [Gilliamella sp.]|uniref:hypothetical protein n=1 Tax=Gilliamella sp. TaxID=1891236 RepID=UPI0025DBDDCE|nr:hypothetical protein [Gilliamella sp.]MCO6539881.1 hypothetical protein [Gilliamella sp.]